MDVGANGIGSEELTMRWETDGMALDAVPSASRFLGFCLSEGGAACLRVSPSSTSGRNVGGAQLTLVASCGLLERIGDLPQHAWAERDYHLPADLRVVVLALRDMQRDGPFEDLHRAAKATELLCRSIMHLRERSLLPLVAHGAVSERDVARVVAARDLIDERWSERLTVAVVARACGISRHKLTRGFRELYDCTVHEALAARRLDEARRILLTTDRPVSVVGYATGYLSNAAFTRAFGRRYGAPPSDYRARRAVTAPSGS
jgi:AraC family transcriptional activator of pyochelin receptor